MNMKNREFIAELHDIRKFVDRQALKQAGIQIRDHTFHDFNFLQIGISPPSSPSWYASKELFRSLAVRMDFVKDYKYLLKGNNDMAKLLSELIKVVGGKR